MLFAKKSHPYRHKNILSVSAMTEKNPSGIIISHISLAEDVTTPL